MDRFAPSLISLCFILIGGCLNQPVTHSPVDSEAEQEHTTAENRPGVDEPLRLRGIPDIALQERSAIDAEDVAIIKRLIESLSEIDRPDYGFSSTMSGSAFLPVDGQNESGVFLITNHGLESSSVLTQLVALGPDALPFLLDSLSDQTPTKIILDHRSGFGGMWFAHEMQTNPLNLLEVEAPELDGSRESIEGLFGEYVQEYTVKVGDLCFVAIGQIVGRRYQAVRYQPTACIVINSPTHDPELADRVRSIWTSDNSHELLFQSLMRDYCSEGSHDDEDSLDVWGVGSRFQCSAVLRLLYYYPNETAELIAERLTTFDVAEISETEGDRFIEREVSNGVRTKSFISAVAWSRNAEVRGAMTELFLRTTDDDLLLAAIPGVNDPQSMILPRRLQPLLRKLPPDEGPIYGRGWQILLAWTKSAPASAESAMKNYIENGETQRLQTACAVLRDSSPVWKVQFLRPFLDDTRELKSWSSSETREVNGEEIKIRLCDMAAYILAAEDEAITFELEGTVEEVDRQITELCQEIDRRSDSE